MTSTPPTYDLVLLLDPQAEQGDRAKIVADTKASIAARGELTRHDEWGERALAYRIGHRTTAEYHLLQFHVTDVALIAELNRVLHITDGVIRFRINKLEAGTPDAPDLKAERGGRESAGAVGDQGEHSTTEQPATAEQPAAA